MKWIVCWINHQYEHTWVTFDSEEAARAFIETQRPNVQFLWRAELVEEFNGGEQWPYSNPDGN